MRQRSWTSLKAHGRSNVVAYLALFLAMSGTAGALRGTNSVTSDDISRGQVKRPDIAAGAITTPKIRAGAVTNAELANDAVDESKVAPASIFGLDFAGDSVDGSDITDLHGTNVRTSTLSEVPLARAGGVGRFHFGSGCNPTSTAYIACATTATGMPSAGRLLILASGNGKAPHDTRAIGTCAISTGATGGFGAVTVRPERIGDESAGGDFQMSVVTPPIGPGVVQVEVACNESVGNISFERIFISSVQISAS